MKGEKRRRKERRRGREDQAKIKRYGCLPLVWNFGFCMETELKYGFMEF